MLSFSSYRCHIGRILIKNCGLRGATKVLLIFEMGIKKGAFFNDNVFSTIFAATWKRLKTTCWACSCPLTLAG